MDSSEELIGCNELTKKVGKAELESLGMPCAQASKEANTLSGSRSMHPNGVNVLNCDGSAHFITNEIDGAVWHALHTRNGAESGDVALAEP